MHMLWPLPGRPLLLLLLLLSFAALLGLRWPDALWLVGFGLTILFLFVIFDFFKTRRGPKIQAWRGLPKHFYLQRPSRVDIEIRGLKDQQPVILDDTPPTQWFSQGHHSSPLNCATSQSYSYQVRPLQRGTARFGPLDIALPSRLGLVLCRYRLTLDSQVQVWPDFLIARDQALRAQFAFARGRGASQRRFMGEGREFSSLQKYQRGDDVRWVDWKASARRGQPIVRRYQAERHQNLILVIDAGRQMTGLTDQGAYGDPQSKLDSAIAGALTMAAAALAQGDRVGLLVFSATVQTWVPPRSELSQLRSLAYALSHVEAQLVESCFDCALRELLQRLHRRSLICLFTDLNDALSARELAHANRLLARRHLSFVVAIGDPVLRQLSRADQDLDALLQNLAARNILQIRAQALKGLAIAGSQVIESSADQLAAGLMNAYFSAKLSGRL